MVSFLLFDYKIINRTKQKKIAKKASHKKSILQTNQTHLIIKNYAKQDKKTKQRPEKLGPGDHAQARLVGPAAGRGVALPRPGGDVREARFCLALQTDHLRTIMVPDPAADDLAGVHGDLRQHRSAADGRAAAVPVLHVGHRDVGLFLGLPGEDLGYLCDQREHLRQGVFSATGDADLGADLQPDDVRDPVPAVHRLFDLLHAERRRCANDSLGSRATAAAGADGGHGAGFRDHHLIADDQVPRPTASGELRGFAVDVCHTSNLPGIGHSAALAVGGTHQPGHTDHRDLPHSLPGGGQRHHGGAAIQRRHDGSGVPDGRGDLQQRGKDLHRYRVELNDHRE